jgi:hypothetical protein
LALGLGPVLGLEPALVRVPALVPVPEQEQGRVLGPGLAWERSQWQSGWQVISLPQLKLMLFSFFLFPP